MKSLLILTLALPLAAQQQWTCTAPGRSVTCTLGTPIQPCPIDADLEKYLTFTGPGNAYDTSNGKVRGNTNTNIAAISGAVQAGVTECRLPDGTLYVGDKAVPIPHK